MHFDFSCSGQRASLRQLTPGSGHSFAPASAPKTDAIGRQLASLTLPHDQLKASATIAQDPAQTVPLTLPADDSLQATWPALPQGALLTDHPIRVANASSF